MDWLEEQFVEEQWRRRNIAMDYVPGEETEAQRRASRKRARALDLERAGPTDEQRVAQCESAMCCSSQEIHVTKHIAKHVDTHRMLAIHT